MIIDNKKFNDLLKEKRITRFELCKRLRISSRTIAKISKGEDVRGEVVNKIINFFNVEYENIVKINNILDTLRKEKIFNIKGMLYHSTQVILTYNSNHIEGSRLTEEQTRYIFETQTIGDLPSNIPLDDIIETNNHFKCIDYIIDNAEMEVNENLLKSLHFILKVGTNHAKIYGAGVYKVRPNTVGGIETALPENTQKEINQLLEWYNSIKKVTFEDIVEFHYRFEKVHPFQDGNGRIGRLLAFKECLKHNIVPFYIDDKFKVEYYNGLSQWNHERGFLIETCRFGQDRYKVLLDYFRINY